MICTAIKGPSYEEAHQQINSVLTCTDIVELRLDGFIALDFSSLAELMSAFSLPMIFALRSRQQGGDYHHSEERRLADLAALAELKPAYLDLESHIPLEFVQEIKERHPEIQRIVSYHNFLETPGNLEGIYQEMQKLPAHFYKVAVTAKNSLDALRLCCWAKQKPGNVIAISMGSYGQFSRVLGPFIGSPIAYTSVEEGLESAPGQLTGDLLLNRYNYRLLNYQTAIYGLIGDPVSQSISDETHNPLMKHLHLNAVYVKVIVKPDELPEFMSLAKQLPFKGLSVTMPLKEHIIPFLDHVDREAHDIGAVNTLLFEGGKVSGFNTDGKGALNAIEQECPVIGKRIVLLGAGGAAKAIAYEAHRRGAILTILNRDHDKAHRLASRVGCIGKGLDQLADCVKEGYDIVINSTPVPMPIDAEAILPQTIVMDIKTKPKEIPFLTSAKNKGCKVIYGYRMFIEQAIGQFSVWFKNQLNLEECRSILEEAAEKVLSKK